MPWFPLFVTTYCRTSGTYSSNWYLIHHLVCPSYSRVRSQDTPCTDYQDERRCGKRILTSKFRRRRAQWWKKRTNLGSISTSMYAQVYVGSLNSKKNQNPPMLPVPSDWCKHVLHFTKEQDEEPRPPNKDRNDVTLWETNKVSLHGHYDLSSQQLCFIQISYLQNRSSPAQWSDKLALHCRDLASISILSSLGWIHRWVGAFGRPWATTFLLYLVLQAMG